MCKARFFSGLLVGTAEAEPFFAAASAVPGKRGRTQSVLEQAAAARKSGAGCPSRRLTGLAPGSEGQWAEAAYSFVIVTLFPSSLVKLMLNFSL